MFLTQVEYRSFLQVPQELISHWEKILTLTSKKSMVISCVLCKWKYGEASFLAHANQKLLLKACGTINLYVGKCQPSVSCDIFLNHIKYVANVQPLSYTVISREDSPVKAFRVTDYVRNWKTIRCNLMVRNGENATIRLLISYVNLV